MEAKILFRIFLSWYVYKNLETKKLGLLKVPDNWPKLKFNTDDKLPF